MERTPLRQAPPVDAARKLDVPAVDFAEIYRDHAAYVWRYLRRLGTAERYVEDLVHDVFVVVHRQLHSYDPTRPLKPWLAGIAFRVGSEHRRRAHVRLETVDGGEALERGIKSLDGEEAMVQRERRRRLGELLDRLAFEQRAVFVLHEIEGYSMPEIAEITEVGINTLYSRLRLAREELRRGLDVVARREQRESR